MCRSRIVATHTAMLAAAGRDYWRGRRAKSSARSGRTHTPTRYGIAGRAGNRPEVSRAHASAPRFGSMRDVTALSNTRWDLGDTSQHTRYGCRQLDVDMDVIRPRNSGITLISLGMNRFGCDRCRGPAQSVWFAMQLLALQEICSGRGGPRVVSSSMGVATNAGRIGGLAVALGIGAAVVVRHGVASADPSAESGSGSSWASSSSTDSSTSTGVRGGSSAKSSTGSSAAKSTTAPRDVVSNHKPPNRSDSTSTTSGPPSTKEHSEARQPKHPLPQPVSASAGAAEPT